jgi:hypothetical protein
MPLNDATSFEEAVSSEAKITPHDEGMRRGARGPSQSAPTLLIGPVDNVASRTLFMSYSRKEYEIDKIHPEDEGDGLPNIQWRLRIIAAAMLGGAAAWAGFIFLI